MKLMTYAAFVVAVSMASCTHYPDEPVRGIDRSSPMIEQIGYTAVRITDGGQVSRSEKDIRLLGFGFVNGSTFNEQFSREPVWTPKDGSWLLSFNESLTIPDYELYVTVRLRKYRTKGGWIDEDHVIPTTRFPYNENEIITSTSILTEGFSAGGDFQDLAAAGQSLYLLTIGATSVWEFDMTTKVSREMLFFGAGDHITSDGNEVFVDVGHRNIYRWSKKKDELGQLIRESWRIDANLRGLAAENGRLYSMEQRRSTGEEWLLTMDYDGVILDSISLAFPEEYYAAIHQGILHVVHHRGWDDDEFLVYRYDIAGRKMLNPLLTPSRQIDGIDISDGFFYYVDFIRDVAARVRYDQMKEVLLSTSRTAPRIFQNGSSAPTKLDEELPLR